MTELSLPQGVEEAGALVCALDRCLAVGLARVGAEQKRELELFASAFEGSPLGADLAAAVAALGRSEFQARHFVALAAARLSLQGACYDALVHAARERFGLRAPTLADERAAQVVDGAAPALAGAQQWLMELAISGFDNLEEDALTPFATTLDALQAQPALAGPAALLTGFLDELLRAAARPDAARPIYRWADLWATALVRAQALFAPLPFEPVSGTFHPFGADLRTHGQFAQLTFVGLLETAGGWRAARIPFSRFKVDAVAGAEICELFRPTVDYFLAALAGHENLNLTGRRFSDGTVVVESATRGAKEDPFALGARLAEEGVAFPSAPPEQRHPVQLGELVHLAKVEVAGDEGAPRIVDPSLPIALERMGSGMGFEPKQLAAMTEAIGMLRFDADGYRFQPLCIRIPKGKAGLALLAGEDALEACAKNKSKTLAILQERAGRLLRR